VWESHRNKHAQAVSKAAASPAHSRKPKGVADSWFGVFENCRFLMRTLGRKIEITDTYLGVKLGDWFQLENQIYTAGVLSEIKRLLFKSLVLLNENHGRVLRDWYWNYSHCLEFVLSRPSALTKEYTYNGLPLGEWFGKQVSLMEKGSLLARQENAMKELLTIIRDRESTDSPSV
jgi:hypothetical protein